MYSSVVKRVEKASTPVKNSNNILTKEVTTARVKQ
jgi:hypothetical protein